MLPVPFFSQVVLTYHFLRISYDLKSIYIPIANLSAKIFLVKIQITARLELPLIETLDSLLQIESHGLHQAQDNEMLSARDNHLLVHFKTEQIVI